MAGALQTPTSGHILINNQDITTMKQKALAKVRMSEIGFILQATNLVPFLTVKQQFTLLKRKIRMLCLMKTISNLCHN